LFIWVGTSFIKIRGGHSLRVFEYRVMRKILETKRQEAVTEWGRLHDEEVHNLYSSLIIWSRVGVVRDLQDGFWIG
jgi:hypothetical protein